MQCSVTQSSAVQGRALQSIIILCSALQETRVVLYTTVECNIGLCRYLAPAGHGLGREGRSGGGEVFFGGEGR